MRRGSHFDPFSLRGGAEGAGEEEAMKEGGGADGLEEGMKLEVGGVGCWRECCGLDPSLVAISCRREGILIGGEEGPLVPMPTAERFQSILKAAPIAFLTSWLLSVACAETALKESSRASRCGVRDETP